MKLDVAGNPVGWNPTTEDFLVHHLTLIRTYKAKLTDKLRDCGIDEGRVSVGRR